MTIGTPEHHFAGVGRVAVAAAHLELMIAGVAFLSSMRMGDTYPLEIVAKPGGAIRALREAIAETGDSRLEQLLEHSEKLLTERHRLIHSVVVLDNSDVPEPVARLFHPRSDEYADILSVDEYDDLAGRIEALAARAVALSADIAQRRADSLRTREGPDA